MIRRSSKYALIGGVCAGYAICEKKPIALVRSFAIALVLLTAGIGGLLFYAAAWILMPASSTGPEGWEVPSAEDKLFRRPQNKVIGGVCGALAEYFKVDATLLRLIAILLLFVCGIGLFAYLAAWAIIPQGPSRATSEFAG